MSSVVQPRPTGQVLRRVVALDRDQIDLTLAVRHGVVVAVALACALAWTSPATAVACAIGALQVGFYDSRGPYRARLEVMATATLALAAVAALARVLDSHVAVAALLSVGVAFAGGLLVALGPWAALAGTQSTVLFLVFTASPIGGSAGRGRPRGPGRRGPAVGRGADRVALAAVRPRGARAPTSLGRAGGAGTAPGRGP